MRVPSSQISIRLLPTLLLVTDVCSLLLQFDECMTGKNAVVGTAGYVAPELLQLKEYSYNVDIWSLGVSSACCVSC